MSPLSVQMREGARLDIRSGARDKREELRGGI
jgi:hypothetical protein